MADRSNKLSLSLIKTDYDEFDQIVKPGLVAFPIDGVGSFYVEESHPRPPDWVTDFFRHALDGKFRIITSSGKGLLLFRVENEGKAYTFAAAFGQGRHLLNDGVVEERFGLKVVLNTVRRDSLRSIDKTSLGSIPKQSREQMSRAGAAENFGIDIEQDSLSSVTGTSRDGRFGKTITGRDSLSASVKVDVTEVADFAVACVERYLADDYKVDFDWIDQIKDVRDPKTVAALDAWLIQRLTAGELDKIWMAPPDILDWVDVKGFRYARRKRAPLQPDLDVADFLAALGYDPVSLDRLKGTSIFVISAKTDEEMGHWNAYRCIYAEAERDGQVYILHNGKWYAVAKSFTEEVIASFNNMAESDIELPEYTHADEGAYNQALPAVIADSVCLDCDTIQHGGGHSSIEFCDLLTADKRLVHVKRYSGSSQLSHLFAQGVVSAELFVQDAAFREKLNAKLPPEHQLADAQQRPLAGDYEVVFAIISKSQNPLDIPFFSKVSLRNAKKRLEGYGYRVSKKKISRGDIAQAQ